MSVFTTQENKITLSLISLSIILLNILTPVHAENSTSDTQLEHFMITLYDTDNMCFPNDELNYVNCKISNNSYECEGFDRVKGTIFKFEDEDGKIVATCTFRHKTFEEVVIHCINFNGTNFKYTKYMVSKWQTSIWSHVNAAWDIISIVCLFAGLFASLGFFAHILWQCILASYLILCGIYYWVKRKYFHASQD